MALAGRSSRSGGGRRLLIAALLATIVVVLIDASLKSRSPAPAQTLDGQAWFDRVLPVVSASTGEGRQIAQIRRGGLGMQAAVISSELSRTAQAAQRDYRTVVSLRAPASIGGAPGLLEACLLVRAQAARSLAAAMSGALTGPAPSAATDPNVQAISKAGQDFQVSDRAYQLFAANVPASLGVSVPPSTWVDDAGQYDPAGLQVYLEALRNSTSLTPLHQLTIQAVSTNPPPVGTQAGAQQIPPTKGIAVLIVVADTGNRDEPNLTITATVSPAAPGQPASVRDFVSLTSGMSRASTIGPIVPVSGAPSTLTVTVTPPAGSVTPPVSTTIQIEVAAPPPPSTTTTSTTTPANGVNPGGTGSSSTTSPPSTTSLTSTTSAGTG